MATSKSGIKAFEFVKGDSWSIKLQLTAEFKETDYYKNSDDKWNSGDWELFGFKFDISGYTEEQKMQYEAVKAFINDLGIKWSTGEKTEISISWVNFEQLTDEEKENIFQFLETSFQAFTQFNIAPWSNT